MVDNGYATHIKYWNFQLSVMSEFSDSEDTEIRLLPFLSIINDQNNNTKGNKRIISQLQALDPEHKSIHPHYYGDFLRDKKEEILKVIRHELQTIDFSTISLFGLTAKYNQWIPGIILAEEVKKTAPHVKIIVGGFGNKNVAVEAMKLCSSFDFCTWGEGEYPLLELMQQLEQDQPELKTVPRLVYRYDKQIIDSETNQSEYLDFDHYIYPDYSDYVQQFPEYEDKEQVSIPINSIRSCHWHRCNFCDFNQGYKLRTRTPDCIINEIKEIYQRYEFTVFTFVDSDTFGSLKHFDELLDGLIKLKYETEEDFSFWAEIIPNSHYNAELMKKMAIAGFKNLFIGYDGLSDGLLKKMNKSNTFSDNIFFVKYSLKNGIYPFTNVIKHIPGETEDDVQECINNLHFLRFFYNDSVVSFSHNYVTLVLSSMSRYYKLLPNDEIARYDTDDLSYLLPKSFSDNAERFHLFRYQKDVPDNQREWDKLTEVEKYYQSNNFTYKVQEHKGVIYYTEYCNDTEIENIVFGEPEYAFVLKACNQQVRSLSSIFDEVKNQFPNITSARLKEILGNLKSSYLLYCDNEFSNIVSVIEV